MERPSVRLAGYKSVDDDGLLERSELFRTANILICDDRVVTEMFYSIQELTGRRSEQALIDTTKVG